MHAHEADGKWQGKWQLWLGDQREQGTAEGADQAALADAVMLAISTRLAPRYVTRPGASSELQLQVQGMNLQHYAELSRVLEPYAPRLRQVDGGTLTYSVTGNREQLRAQLGLAKLQELPLSSPLLRHLLRRQMDNPPPPSRLRPSRSTACVFAGKECQA